METTALTSLFSKIGATSELDKKLVFELYLTVFNGMEVLTGSSIIVSPPIVAFRAQLQKHVRCHPFKYLSAAKLAAATGDAEAEFNKVVMIRVQEGSSRMTMGMIEGARRQLNEERAWIEKINGWKREDFLQSNLDDAVSKFKAQLWNDYFLENNESDVSSKTPARGGIRDFGLRLGQNLVGELVAQVIPSFEEKSEVTKWVGRLEHRFAQIVSQGEASEQKISNAVAQYRAGMSEFLAKHRFADTEKLELTHAEMTTGVEVDPAYARLLADPVLTSVWNKKTQEEYDHLLKNWRAEGHARIGALREGMKSQCAKMLKESYNNFPEDGGVVQLEMEALFSPDFDKVMRRILKKVEEINLSGEHPTTPAGSSGSNTAKEVRHRLNPPEAATVGRVRDVTPTTAHGLAGWLYGTKLKRTTAKKGYPPLHTRLTRHPRH